jgi:hypothetical protein
VSFPSGTPDLGRTARVLLNAPPCDAELGPLAALYGSLFALFVILGVVCVSFPCIAFACAWCTCVQNKQALVRNAAMQTTRCCVTSKP